MKHKPAPSFKGILQTYLLIISTEFTALYISVRDLIYTVNLITRVCPTPTVFKDLNAGYC